MVTRIHHQCHKCHPCQASISAPGRRDLLTSRCHLSDFSHCLSGPHTRGMEIPTETPSRRACCLAGSHPENTRIICCVISMNHVCHVQLCIAVRWIQYRMTYSGLSQQPDLLPASRGGILAWRGITSSFLTQLEVAMDSILFLLLWAWYSQKGNAYCSFLFWFLPVSRLKEAVIHSFMVFLFIALTKIRPLFIIEPCPLHWPAS